MKKFILLALLCAFSAGAFAQHGDPPPGPPSGTPGGKPEPTPAQIAANEVKFLGVLLDLTQAQEDSALTIFTATETTKATLEATIETQHAALVTAVLANNASGMTTAANAIGTATAAIELADAQSEAAFNALLTAAQKTKYASFLKGDFVVPGNGEGPGHGHGPDPNPGHGHGH